jgi:hypothetical protein
MKNLVHICKKNENGTLTIIDTELMFEELDNDSLEVFVTFQGNRYQVHGDYRFGYIILD